MEAGRDLMVPAFSQPVIQPGEVWLVGAGPGAPGQLTLDALAALQQADVVLHDALIDPRVLALAGPGARLEPAGKRGGQPSADQDDISERLIELACSGLRVVRLKGGDPFVFGRGGEEVLALAESGIRTRVIPGLTAGLAGLAAFSIPATMRGINQAVILCTGHGGDDGELDWQALARTGQPLVIYMVARTIAPITTALIEGGLAPTTPAVVISAATTPQERILVSTLTHVAMAARTDNMPAPALLVIGGIATFREQLAKVSTSGTQA